MTSCLVKIRRSPFYAALSLLVFFSLLVPTRPLAEVKARKLHEMSHISSLLHSSRLASIHPEVETVAETIWQESKKYSLDPMLVLAIIRIESEFHPAVVSPDGARGLMQLRPPSAHALAEAAELEEWEGANSLDDPIINIKLGVLYLNYLKERFGDLKVALTAYHRGPTWVQRQIESKAALPVEYAQKVISLSRDYRARSRQTKSL
ncbi:MAG TPA: lytic transglycosylase domain-containing protein [Candidatus Binatia bacterium]